jgi:hypothetical protein
MTGQSLPQSSSEGWWRIFHVPTLELDVMRGLDPRIHSSARTGGGMDRRVKPGDDSLHFRGGASRL